jgi:thymidine kinase
MAHLYPTPPTLRQGIGYFRELDVLERLRLDLPDAFEVFHEVHWHAVHEGQDRHGEIDLVVMSPAGHLLLMEVKAGQVVLREGGVFKLYGKTNGQAEKDVLRQSRVQFGATAARLSQAGLYAPMISCIVLPDYRLPTGAVVAVPRERIVTADEFGALGQHVLALFSGLTTVQRSSASLVDVDAVRRFLCNEFQVSPSMDALQGQLQIATTRLSDGLATWVPRLSSPSDVVRVQATAGSGKTQLAWRLVSDAVAAEQAVCYVCFNRPLADVMRGIMPTRATVTSFHEWAMEHFRCHRGEPDYLLPAVYDLAAEAVHSDRNMLKPTFDVLIVDEAQDFAPEWMEALLCLLKDSARLYVLEDPAQRLYERETFELPDAVVLRCSDNHRSPRAVCQTINALGLSSPPVQARSPHQGDVPVFRRYGSDKQLLVQTEAAVQDLLSQGFALADIAILSGRGHIRSVLLSLDKLGPWTVQRFTGRYLPEGEPQIRPGQLLVESVYRFKGQSASAVVLSEWDFESLNDHEKCKLFVGMTRACLALQVVLSERTELMLAELL